MSTLEATISMLEQLPEPELVVVFQTTKALLENHKKSPFKPLTKEQVMSDLAISRKQFENGQYSAMSDIIESLRDRNAV
ncbi:MAG: hypothetical protein IJV59_09255 [Eubacterium sp.]|nr:hypothetical protein [Eubacterium sp.]